MYKCQDILEEKLGILKQYMNTKNIECDKTMVRDYLMKIRVGDKGQFDLYYKPKKDKFTPLQGTLDSEIYNQIVEFIECGWTIDDGNNNKNDNDNKISYIEDKKEDNKRRKNTLYLKQVYEVISKYKDYNIEYESLINAIKQVCTEDEYRYIKDNEFDFDLLQNITLRYIKN